MLKHFAWKKATMPEAFTDNAVAFYLGAKELLTNPQFQDNSKTMLKHFAWQKATMPEAFTDNAVAFYLGASELLTH